MTISILMPALSPTMEEGTLSKWLIKIGDKVNPGDLLAEIETDKATMEVECIEEGFVSDLLFKEGTESIKINTPIATLSSSNKEEKEKYLKERIKDSFVLFVLSGSIHYLIHEYFHNDFVSKIFPKVSTSKSADIFTDQPGF